jgi:hypothetical protein
MLVDVGGRPEGNPGGGNRILNNLLVDNGWQISLRTPKNVCDHNLFGSMRQVGGGDWGNRKRSSISPTGNGVGDWIGRVIGPT